jgi:cell division protein FtsL
MNPLSLLDRRYRGFRLIEVGGLGVLLVLALVVYLAKTHAGGERADIDHIQAQIDDEQTRVTLLKAEVAKLEQPERLETLSGRYLNLQPIPPNHEISVDALASVAHPAPAAKTAPQPRSSTPASAATAPAAVAAADTDAPR